MNKKKNLLINNAMILYDNSKVLKNHALFIEDGLIKEVGISSKLTEKHKNYANIIDAKQNIVFPGLINSHMHFYSTFARGITLNSPPNKNFVDILKNLWWRLDKLLTEEDNYYCAVVPIISSIKKGTTTIIDHHSSPNAVGNSLETIRKAYYDTGLRGLTCYEVSDRDGKGVCEKAVRENMDFIEKYNSEKNALVKGMFGLHAAFTLKDDTLAQIKECNGKNGFHIHVSEAPEDSKHNMDMYGITAVERLYKFGVTGDKSIFAHCNHLTKADIAIIKETKTNVVHNPQSNMKNGVGTADIISYIDKGINVGIGTDGMSSSMFEAVNFASLIHKHDKRNSNIGFEESRKLILENNPLIASNLLGYSVGRIKEGYKADIIILDYEPPTPFNDESFWGHVLFGVIPSGRVKTTIVDGKVLMRDYELTMLDEVTIHNKARELAQLVWDRF